MFDECGKWGKKNGIEEDNWFDFDRCFLAKAIVKSNHGCCK